MSAIELAEFLKQRASALKLSVTMISNKAGISRQTWYRLVNADVRQARVETLVRVADVLQVNLVELSSLYSQKSPLYKKSLIKVLKESSDACAFIRDVTYPLNTMVHRGELFEKKWEISNLGNLPWVDRCFVCVDGELDIHLKHSNNRGRVGERGRPLRAQYSCVPVPYTAPGEHVILSAWFRAPETSGTVISFWKLIDESGDYCFPTNTGLSCQVRVVKKP